jgi:hypothetical protein
VDFQETVPISLRSPDAQPSRVVSKLCRDASGAAPTLETGRQPRPTGEDTQISNPASSVTPAAIS